MIGKYVAIQDGDNEESWHLGIITDPIRNLATLVCFDLSEEVAKRVAEDINRSEKVLANVPVVLSQEALKTLQSGEVPDKRRIRFYEESILGACGNGAFRKVHLVLAE